MTAELKVFPDLVKETHDRIAADLRQKVEAMIESHGDSLSGFAIVTWDKNAATNIAANNSGPCMLPLRLLPAFVAEVVRGYLIQNDIEKFVGTSSGGAS